MSERVEVWVLVLVTGSGTRRRAFADWPALRRYLLAHVRRHWVGADLPDDPEIAIELFFSIDPPIHRFGVRRVEVEL